MPTSSQEHQWKSNLDAERRSTRQSGQSPKRPSSDAGITPSSGAVDIPTGKRLRSADEEMRARAALEEQRKSALSTQDVFNRAQTVEEAQDIANAVAQSTGLNADLITQMQGLQDAAEIEDYLAAQAAGQQLSKEQQQALALQAQSQLQAQAQEHSSTKFILALATAALLDLTDPLFSSIIGGLLELWAIPGAVPVIGQIIQVLTAPGIFGIAGVIYILHAIVKILAYIWFYRMGFKKNNKPLSKLLGISGGVLEVIAQSIPANMAAVIYGWFQSSQRSSKARQAALRIAGSTA